METPLTQNIGPGKSPPNLQQYRANGGYRAAHKALLEMESKDILQLLQDANLRGRGGAGRLDG